jgi:hypothetical protein
LPKNPNKQDSHLIYSDITWRLSQESQLVHLSAEVLRDQRHVVDFQAWKLMDYLETQKKLLLVSKIVDKNKKPSSVRWRRI